MNRIGTVFMITVLIMAVVLQISTLQRSAQAAQPVLSLNSTTIKAGDTGSLELSISGDDAGTYAGVNARILLPAGVSVTEVSGGGGLPSENFTVDHATSSTNGTNEVTVIAYSRSSTFKGDRRVLLSVNLQVAANVAQGTYDAKFAASNSNLLINSRHALSNSDGSTSVAHSIQSGSLIVSSSGGIDTDGDGIPDSIDPDDDNDGMDDKFEEKFGLNPLVDDSGGDLDGDGISNLDEYKQGKDPTVMDIVHVDFKNSGTQAGTINAPYNTVGKAVNEVAAGGQIIIKAGSTDETPVIGKEVIIDASGGEAVIGE